jgi:hypothetical protein
MNNNDVFCPGCGAKQLRPDASFCHQCGTAIPRSAAAVARPVARRFSHLVWIVPLVALGVLVLAGLAMANVGQKALMQIGLVRPSPTITPTPTPTRPTATPTRTLTPSRTATAAPTGTRTPTFRPSSTTAPTGRVAAGGDRLNLRQGPGTVYDVVALLNDGDTVTILGQDPTGAWVRVSSQGTTGWAAAEFISLGASRNTLPVLTPPPTPDRPAIDPRWRVDRGTIAAGECTTLRWDVDGVSAIYLDGHGAAGHGSQQVCPTQSQTYVLTIVQRDGRTVQWPLRIIVSGTAAALEFQADSRGCISHNQRLGQVKGQVFDRNGNIIVNARVEITVDGQSNVVPVGRSNEDGWYEFTLNPGQVVRFVRLEVGGRNVGFAPADLQVTSQSGCYQRVDFRQR